MNHPVVPLVLSRLNDDKDTRVRMVLDRGDTVAVIAENAQVRRHVIVEKINGQWAVPTFIGGHGTQPPYVRPARAGQPPMLSERQIVKSGWPQPNGSPPIAAWCVVSGVAAMDARIVIVTTSDDEQRCAVPDDGFIAVLIYAKWGETPRITVGTYNGTKEPG